MQVIDSTIDSLIHKNDATGVTGVAASVHEVFSVTHSPDDLCNGGNKDPSETLDGTPVAHTENTGVTLEPHADRGGTPVARVTPEKFNGLQMETGYTRVQIDFSKLTSFIHSEHPEEANRPSKVGSSELPDIFSAENPAVMVSSESVSYRHWVVKYPDSVVECVFCPPISFEELMHLDSEAIAAEPVGELNTNMRVMSYERAHMLKDADMHGCDECMNLSSIGVCEAATKLGAMPGYRPVLGRSLDHRCLEWKPP